MIFRLGQSFLVIFISVIFWKAFSTFLYLDTILEASSQKLHYYLLNETFFHCNNKFFLCRFIMPQQNENLYTFHQRNKWFLKRITWSDVDKNLVIVKIFLFYLKDFWTSFHFVCLCSKLAYSQLYQCDSTLFS
jgi:hypothetical protein